MPSLELSLLLLFALLVCVKLTTLDVIFAADIDDDDGGGCFICKRFITLSSMTADISDIGEGLCSA